ncbi:hypothetical protein FA13DRAFT_1714396 [Coprinellus micaceus]|uniref:Uncharacterized protein n=1 Tax=Coprinellus micaceus TaxID=71717 RepID=A0A4Y7SSH3_COPMI|nr:hypothetical protein FA13DRAFT_1714396 [Coprinellus micaceus]
MPTLNFKTGLDSLPQTSPCDPAASVGSLAPAPYSSRGDRNAASRMQSAALCPIRSPPHSAGDSSYIESMAHNSQIFAEFPWFTPPLSRTNVWPGSAYAPLLKMASSRVSLLHIRLGSSEASEQDDLLKTMGISHALIPGHGILQGLVSNPSVKVSNEKISNLASLLLNYRLYDVLCGISSPHLSNVPFGQGVKYPIPEPSRIFYRRMENWTKVVQQGLIALRDASYFDHSVPVEARSEPSEFNASTSLFASLSRRLNDIDGHVIMSNFESAALYMSILFQLNDPGADIPSTIPLFEDFIEEVIPDARKQNNWETFFSRLKKPHTFKLPLYLALAVSGMWQGLGGARPESLLQVDLKIYRALADVALGLCIPQQRFAELFHELSHFDWSAVTFADAQWLNADPDFLGRQGAATVVPSDLLERLDSLCADENANHVGESLVDRPDPVVPGSDVCDNMLLPNHSTAVTSGAAHDVLAPDGIACPNNGSSEVSTTVGAGGNAASQTGGSTAHDGPTRRSCGSPNAEEPTSQNAKKRHQYRAVPRTSRPRYRAPAKAYQTVNLSNEQTTYPIHALRIEIDSSFESREDLHWFQKVWAASRRPPATPQLSMSSQAELLAWSSLDAQSVLQEKHIVVTNIQRTSGFTRYDEAALKSICSLVRAVPAHDYASSPHKVAYMTMKSFLDVVNRFSTLPTVWRSGPIPLLDSSTLAPRAVASDILAWDATINQPWCHTWCEMPRNSTQFGCVSTSSAFTKAEVVRNGFGLYFEIQVGSMWVAISHHPRDPTSQLDTAPRDADLETVHLTPGSAMWASLMVIHGAFLLITVLDTSILRPGTPYVTMATEHCIARGSHWYGSSTLAETYASIASDFITRTSGPNDQDARKILRRLAHFYHMVYTSGLFLANRKCDECGHSPDITTPRGLENILSLSNLMELGNIFASDDYTDSGISQQERQEIVEARRLCRIIVTWIHSHFCLFDPDSGRELSIRNDVWMPYLARHILIIRRHRAVESKSGDLSVRRQAAACVATLDLSFSDNPSLQFHLSGLKESGARLPGWRHLQPVRIEMRLSALEYDTGAIFGENPADYKYYKFLSKPSVSANPVVLSPYIATGGRTYSDQSECYIEPYDLGGLEMIQSSSSAMRREILQMMRPPKPGLDLGAGLKTRLQHLQCCILCQDGLALCIAEGIRSLTSDHLTWCLDCQGSIDACCTVPSTSISRRRARPVVKDVRLSNPVTLQENVGGVEDIRGCKDQPVLPQKPIWKKRALIVVISVAFVWTACAWSPVFAAWSWMSINLVIHFAY